MGWCGAPDGTEAGAARPLRPPLGRGGWLSPPLRPPDMVGEARHIGRRAEWAGWARPPSPAAGGGDGLRPPPSRQGHHTIPYGGPKIFFNKKEIYGLKK